MRVVCVCFQVEATHTYTGEDIDELSFEPGDIIYVVPFDNEEEQVGTECNNRRLLSLPNFRTGLRRNLGMLRYYLCKFSQLLLSQTVTLSSPDTNLLMLKCWSRWTWYGYVCTHDLPKCRSPLSGILTQSCNTGNLSLCVCQRLLAVYFSEELVYFEGTAGMGDGGGNGVGGGG